MSAVNMNALRYQSPEHEIADLKQKLLEMSQLCQQLQEQFELMENKMRNSELQKTNSLQEENTSNGHDFASLKEKIKELVAMNMNWQQYSSRQEKIIHDQNERIAQLERDLESKNPRQLPESQQIEFDRLLLAKKHECNTLEEEKERAAEENHRLHLRLVEVETSLAGFRERCGLLEAQLVMYQEDFRTERADRERAQSTISELEAKLRDRNQMAFPVQATSEYHGAYGAFDCPSSYEAPLRGRGIYQTDSDTGKASASLPTEQLKTTDGRLKDAVNLPAAAAASAYQTDGFDETDHPCVLDLTEDLPNLHISLGDVLSCPKCHRAFTRDHHLALLEHMEECN